MSDEAAAKFFALRQETIQALREAIIEADEKVEVAHGEVEDARAELSAASDRLREARKDRETLVTELQRIDPTPPAAEGGE